MTPMFARVAAVLTPLLVCGPAVAQLDFLKTLTKSATAGETKAIAYFKIKGALAETPSNLPPLFGSEPPQAQQRRAAGPRGGEGRLWRRPSSLPAWASRWRWVSWAACCPRCARRGCPSRRRCGRTDGEPESPMSPVKPFEKVTVLAIPRQPEYTGLALVGRCSGTRKEPPAMGGFTFVSSRESKQTALLA